MEWEMARGRGRLCSSCQLGCLYFTFETTTTAPPPPPPSPSTLPPPQNRCPRSHTPANWRVLLPVRSCFVANWTSNLRAANRAPNAHSCYEDIRTTLHPHTHAPWANYWRAHFSFFTFSCRCSAAQLLCSALLLCCVFWFTKTNTNKHPRVGSPALGGSPALFLLLPGALICCFTGFLFALRSSLSALLSPCRWRHFCIISYKFAYFMGDFDFFSTCQSCL